MGVRLLHGTIQCISSTYCCCCLSEWLVVTARALHCICTHARRQKVLFLLRTREYGRDQQLISTKLRYLVSWPTCHPGASLFDGCSR
uniref:Uncharacterized protein n=1 Tax=Hyaloperonospora arabidopsidis (strain Emoy2) TaxID=559515 RepID=M4C0G1_HYAAE